MTTFRIHIGEDYYEINEFLDDRDMEVTRYRGGKAPGARVSFESLTPHQQNEIIHRILKAKNAHRTQRESYYRD
jgi:hypothetical protein